MMIDIFISIVYIKNNQNIKSFNYKEDFDIFELRMFLIGFIKNQNMSILELNSYLLAIKQVINYSSIL